MSSLRAALPAKITTPRLTLTAPAMADLDELVPLANNDRVTRWTARMPFPYARADGVRFLSEVANGSERPYSVRNETGAFIGIVSLMFGDRAIPELGYWLGEPFWRKGYGREAVGALLDAADATGLTTAVHASALADNHGSLRILESTGFRRIRQAMGDCGRSKGRLIVYLERRTAR